MNVVLFGPPGVGKGTQGVHLARAFGLTQLATGDLLRSEVEAGSALGREAKSYMEAGRLVPDGVVVGMIESRMTQGSGLLLDGFPRNVAQAEALDAMLADHGARLDRIIFMDADRSELVRRLAGRRICRDCGRSFHVHFRPPAVEGVCDDCGGALFQREDDRPEVIGKRLDVYHEQTAPLIAFYRGRAGFRAVDGGGTLEEVRARLHAAME
ncbi:MAG: adenylate kinase [Zetaproteobacteria bacterium]|nr:MAG: adenylate kinase [Zetaproteobacteria bacterium]